jgi:hypothetical protein
LAFSRREVEWLDSRRDVRVEQREKAGHNVRVRCSDVVPLSRVSGEVEQNHSSAVGRDLGYCLCVEFTMCGELRSCSCACAHVRMCVRVSK